jgi:hypothetical protein
MKKICFFLVFTCACLMTAFAQSDANTIRQLIEAESYAYHHNPDRAAFTRYWHIHPESRMVYSGPESSSLFTGTDMEKAIAANQFPPADLAVNEYSHFVVRVNDLVAWASFDQKSTLPDGKISTMHEFRLLEKINGTWKILQSSVHEYIQK